jgi:hypothetical protein
VIPTRPAAIVIVVVVVALGRPGMAKATDVTAGSWQRVVGSQKISEDRLPRVPGCAVDTEVEPDIAMDPNDADVVVAVFQEGRCEGGAEDLGFATSLDGGRTWAFGDMPGLTRVVGGPFDRASDPSVAFGPDGSVYVAGIAFNQRDPCRSAVAVGRSDDHGHTFGPPVLLADGCTPFNDKPWIAVDTFAGSPFLGRIYVAWSALGPGGRLVARHSDDRGETWSRLAEVVPAGTPEGAFPLVQPGGDLTILYRVQFPTGAVRSRTSHDGGDHFDAPVQVSDYEGIEPDDLRTGGGVPGGAVDAVTGTMYAVWQDARFRTDGRNDIVISSSSRAGRSWTPVRRVNPPDPPGRSLNHFVAAVAAFRDAVHVSYLVRNEVTGQYNRVYTMEATSLDGGDAFGPDVVLGDAWNLAYAARSGEKKFVGDYMGITASGEAVHAVWCRSFAEPGRPRTRHQATWSATILP